jgi:hypothetical protein
LGKKNSARLSMLGSSDNNEFHSATAKTVQDAQKLDDAGFEYVCDFDDTKLFRMRK